MSLFLTSMLLTGCGFGHSWLADTFLKRGAKARGFFFAGLAALHLCALAALAFQ